MIPKRIHFIWLGNKEHPFRMNTSHYLSIKSAMQHNPDYEFFFHTIGLLDKSLYSEGEDTMERHNLFEEIFGDPRMRVVFVPFDRMQKFYEFVDPTAVITRYDDEKINPFIIYADWYRFEVLREYGGIYSDLDSITLKSYDELLRYQVVTASEEFTSKAYKRGTASIGLILSEPDHAYCNDMIQAFENLNFEDWYWNFSVKNSTEFIMTPGRYSSAVIRLPYKKGFYYPNYRQDLVQLFCQTTSLCRKEYENCYAHHLWNSNKNGKELIAECRSILGNLLNMRDGIHKWSYRPDVYLEWLIRETLEYNLKEDWFR